MQLHPSASIPKSIQGIYGIAFGLIMGSIAAPLILIVVLAGVLFRLVAGRGESISTTP
jgi:hypothetical protein